MRLNKPKATRYFDAPDADPDAKRVEEMFERRDQKMRDMSKFDPQRLLRMARRGWVDRPENARVALNRAGLLGEKAARELDLISGAPGAAQNIIDDATAAIYADLTPTQTEDLHRVIEAYRTHRNSRVQA